MPADLACLIGGYARFVVLGIVPFIAHADIVPLIAGLSYCIWLPVKGVRSMS